MDTKIKTEWIEALRSGDYRQGKNALLDADGDYCCLGVLAAIQGAAVEGIQDSVELELDGVDYGAGLTMEQRNVLADMNDGRGCAPRSFDHIAGYVYTMIEDTP